jgi:RNA 2',3'-cyclic 3'-phosphodiesterase
MRLFAALLPPPAVARELDAVVRALQALPDAGRLRWTPREGRHLTLAFYGEVEEESLPELRTRLGRAAHHGRPLDLRISGGGRFGDRTLWAGAAGDLQPLRRLARAAEAAGRRTGVPHTESRGFRPHLTLARTRAGRWDLRPYAAALEPFASESWQADELTLVRSHLPPGGVPGAHPRYEPLASWPLGGPLP